MTRDRAIEIATRFVHANNYAAGTLELAHFLPASPPVRDTDEWAVILENRTTPGSSLAIRVDPRTGEAVLFVPRAG
jgi:hypothetical protein